MRIIATGEVGKRGSKVGAFAGWEQADVVAERGKQLGRVGLRENKRNQKNTHAPDDSPRGCECNASRWTHTHTHTHRHRHTQTHTDTHTHTLHTFARV